MEDAASKSRRIIVEHEIELPSDSVHIFGILVCAHDSVILYTFILRQNPFFIM